MANESFKNVLDSLDYIIVHNNREYLGIDNLETTREYLFNKRDGEYKHIDMYVLPNVFWQIKFIIENNVKFNNDEIKAEYIKLRKQLINWYV